MYLSSVPYHSPYDSLGEAYMENGDKELAIQNYKKSIELNPANQNAVEMLKRLERNSFSSHPAAFRLSIRGAISSTTSR